MYLPTSFLNSILVCTYLKYRGKAFRALAMYLFNIYPDDASLLDLKVRGKINFQRIITSHNEVQVPPLHVASPAQSRTFGQKSRKCQKVCFTSLNNLHTGPKLKKMVT